MDSAAGFSVRVRGLVQGVGFRPTVWRIANELKLDGEVLNDSAGVLIRIWCDSQRLELFTSRLIAERPPLARIDQIEIDPIGFTVTRRSGFHIVGSQSGAIQTGVIPDASMCEACRSEVRKVANRRYRYAFTNCTHCGPRLSIVRKIPYDRTNTSMDRFSMCDACQREYEDPKDRRFHAQPNACGECGPKVWLEDCEGSPYKGVETDAIADCATLIQNGAIVAIKGIGGFHLACDATNESVVAKLRKRKRRYLKPFALMARDVSMIEHYCHLSQCERNCLSDSAAPIVILDTKKRSHLASSIAPGQHTVGFMLPYTPLHQLLMDELATPVVLTSGNLSDEPQCVENSQAKERLSSIADFFLLHDRDILNRVDDSVVRMMDGKIQLLRRARGFAPAPIVLPDGFSACKPVLAMGGELKNCFCLLQDGQAVLSQHIGDLEEVATQNAYKETIALYQELFQHRLHSVAIDLHPGYHATQHGRALAQQHEVSLVEVQHHHAHIAACMVENGVPMDSSPLLGIALDGLGYGEDHTLWGGEFLLADYSGFSRVGRLRPTRLLGGDRTAIEPWRNTYVQLSQLGLDALIKSYGTLPIIEFLANQPCTILDQMLDKGLNSPYSSSMGRLFDAVAAAIGICCEQSFYEGQAAIELEMLAHSASGSENEGYPFSVERMSEGLELGTVPMWELLLEDLKKGRHRAEIAKAFHRGLGNALVDMAVDLCSRYEVSRVALSGGVFQNRILFEQVTQRLKRHSLEVLTHRQVPANDGGLALGMAAVAATKSTKG